MKNARTREEFSFNCNNDHVSSDITNESDDFETMMTMKVILSSNYYSFLQWPFIPAVIIMVSQLAVIHATHVDHWIASGNAHFAKAMIASRLSMLSLMHIAGIFAILHHLLLLLLWFRKVFHSHLVQFSMSCKCLQDFTRNGHNCILYFCSKVNVSTI